MHQAESGVYASAPRQRRSKPPAPPPLEQSPYAIHLQAPAAAIPLPPISAASLRWLQRVALTLIPTIAAVLENGSLAVLPPTRWRLRGCGCNHAQSFFARNGEPLQHNNLLLATPNGPVAG